MDTSSLVLVCVLLTCSVWMVQGRNVRINSDDQEQAEVEVSVEAGKLPGVCWACKWALNKVKKQLGNNETAERITSKLKSVCSKIGLLKKICQKFVLSRLGELVEELTTTDDVRTICVNARACKEKPLIEVIFLEDDEDPQIQIRNYA